MKNLPYLQTVTQDYTTEIKKRQPKYRRRNKRMIFLYNLVFTSLCTTGDIKGGLIEQNNQIM